MARKRVVKYTKGGRPADYQLPGVGEGLVDPDFDKLNEGEVEGILGSVGAHHGRAEDYE
jgi:hypothetical protein